jgi:PAS domain S-box-containing protein
MHVQATLYVIPLLFAAALSGALSLYALRHRRAVGSLGFATMTLAVTVWALGYAFEIAGADLATKIAYAKLEYLAIVLVPVAWLVFALQFSQRQHWLTHRIIVLLLVVPSATWLLAISNETHRLIWHDTSLDDSGPFLALQVSHGGWFWVHFGYSYLLLLLGTILIGIAAVRTTHIYRRQALAVLLATLFPWVGNVLYVTGRNPIPQLDLTPLTFTLTSIIWGWGIFGFRLLDIAPVAREAVLEAMRDGVLTLDTQDRIVGMNPAAARMIGVTNHQAVGQSATQLLGSQFDVLKQHPGDGETQTELTVGEGSMRRDFQLRMSQIEDRQARPLGRLIMLRDVTEERRLERLRDDLTNTMVHDLRNPLTAMVGALSLIEILHQTKGDISNFLQIAVRSTTMMLSLVNAILDVSRLESGQISLNCAWQSLDSLADEIFEVQRPLAHEKNQ